MHGLGNDFMVIDAVRQTCNLTSEHIAAWGQRDTGVGFDQCLVVEPSHEVGIDFYYRIFNADGQEVGQCGNGARCLARFVYYYGLTTKKQITVATKTTRMQLTINDDETVTVVMPRPELNPARIPMTLTTQAPYYSIPVGDDFYDIQAIQVGNPHAVLCINDINTAEVSHLGKLISEHAWFPEQTNVGFMQILNPSHIKLRVYERGCGETQACGSGAVAAAAIGILYHQLTEKVTVTLPGGSLLIHWPNIQSPISITGPVTFIYEGRFLK